MKIFITGVSSGIGRATAIQLTKEHDVWGVSRKSFETKFKVSVCDVTDKQAMKKVADDMRVKDFIPDVFILNAGVLKDDNDGLDFEACQETFRVNVEGVLYWIAEFLPDCLARDRGTFIAISSTAAYRPNGMMSYSASKAAVAMAFRQLRLTYPQLIFQTVYFGPTETKLYQGRRSFMVTSPEKVAKYLVTLLKKGTGTHYFPFLLTLLVRVLPDKLFTYVKRFT